MRNMVSVLLLLVLLATPTLGQAQSFPRMGGERSANIYGFGGGYGGGEKVYGLNTRRKNLTGVSSQKRMLQLRRYRDNTLLGVAGTSRIYSRGWTRSMFSRTRSGKYF